MVTEFDESLDAYEQAAVKYGSPRDIYWAMALRATQATMRGDLIAGEQLARGAALRGSELEQSSAGAHLLQRFVVRYQQGRLREELPTLRHFSGTTSVFRAGAALPRSPTPRSDRPIVRVPSPATRSVPTATIFRATSSGWRRLRCSRVPRPTPLIAGSWTCAAALLAPCADHVIVFGAGAAVLGPVHFWLGGARRGGWPSGRRARALRRGDRDRAAPRCSVLDRTGGDRRRGNARARGRAADEPEIDRLRRDAVALADTGGYELRDRASRRARLTGPRARVRTRAGEVRA